MTAELSFRIHTAAVTALAFVCTYVLAFYWNLDRPFWAGFTVFVISLPSIGQTLQKGVLRMFGTIAGAVAALVLLGLFAQERMLLLSVLSLYLCLMLYLMLTSVYYGYAFFISCIVTLRERLETLGLCAIIRHVEETELYATAQNREGN